MKKSIINKNTIETLTIKKWHRKRMKAQIKASRQTLHVLMSFMLILVSSITIAQVSLDSINFKNTSNGKNEFIFKFDSVIQKPEVFMTVNPPRLALDMQGVVNNSGVKLMPVSQGNTKSVRIVSTSKKTRAVIDLFNSAKHSLKVVGNKLIVTVDDDTIVNQVKTSNSNKFSVENIDFRRGKNGEGRVIVQFNKPGVVVNLKETADKIKLQISSATLPESLNSKLDVIDFATPVSFVDTRARDGNVNVDISASGNYEHIAYQTGSKYIVEIKERTQTAIDNTKTLNEEIVYEGNKVGFNLQDVPIRSVLALIADVSEFNIVVASSVEGNVTLRLDDVPWDQALDVVLKNNQLGQRKQGNVILVAPAKEIAEREKAELKALNVKEEFEPLKTIYIQINYSKASELANLLSGGGSDVTTSSDVGDNGTSSSLLSERGSVTFDSRTNTLLVTDVPSKLVVVEELIKKLDRAIRQVQIETRIVIATDNFGDELGVRFGVTGSKEDRHGNILSTGGSLSALDSLNRSAVDNRINSPSGSGLPNFGDGYPNLGDRLNVNLPTAAGAASKWAMSILAADYLLDLELSALETEGRGEVVSEPRVVTTNQTKAVITQGVEIPYEQVSTGGGAAGGLGISTIAFKKAELSMEVTPLITPDNRVDLTLKIVKNSVGKSISTASGATVPAIDTRSIETRVLVGNGQTIVLGGVFEQVKTTTKNKTPILGDIPGIGSLFRNRKASNDKAELLVFVTPTIIKESL